MGYHICYEAEDNTVCNCAVGRNHSDAECEDESGHS